MTTDARSPLLESTYLALGRFAVEFSGVLNELESSTIHLVALGGFSLSLHAALADRTASAIVASFFAVAQVHWKEHLTERDREILAGLRRELEELVGLHDRLMRDAWMAANLGSGEQAKPTSRQRVIATSLGVDFKHQNYRPTDIELLVLHAHRLAGLVHDTAWYHRPGQDGPGLAARMDLVDGKVVLRR